jgi:NADH dehydrogenase
MGQYSQKNLTKRGVAVVLEDGVAEVDGAGLRLQSGRRIESATVVWSAGVKPVPLIGELPLMRNKRGALITNRDFSLPDHPELWALGDCAAVPTDRPGTFYPATAQHAIREGPVLAKNILAKLRGKPTKLFSYTSLGSMASLGARRGVAELPGGLVLTGFPAWFIWRTYYLSRLPGFDRKVRVALDWFIGLFFPRDIAELRIFTPRAQAKGTQDANMTSESPKDTAV